MSRGFDRRVELEMALLKLCSPELDESVDAILRRLARLEKQPRAVIPEQAEAAAPSIKPPAAPMESPRPQTKPQGTNAEPEGCGEEPAVEAADMLQEQEPPEDKKAPVDMEAFTARGEADDRLAGGSGVFKGLLPRDRFCVSRLCGLCQRGFCFDRRSQFHGV